MTFIAVTFEACFRNAKRKGWIIHVFDQSKEIISTSCLPFPIEYS